MKKIECEIIEVQDYPIPGIVFKDLTPVWKDQDLFNILIDKMTEIWVECEIDTVASIESRGFVVGAPIAYKLNAGFVPLRKPNKLPREVYSQAVSLEYGETEIQVHKDAFQESKKVLIIDDLLATGGTATAAFKLIPENLVTGFGFMVELRVLNGRKKIEEISDARIESLVIYD